MEREESRENFSADTCFGLLRHGTTLWNEEKRIQGSLDSRLSLAGKEKMHDWARFLAAQHWSRILASDLGRAKESAAILNSIMKVPVTFESRLREQHWGEWEGRRIEEIRAKYSEEVARQVASGWDFRPPLGESRREVLQRSWIALHEASLAWPQQKILIVCHQGIIKCLISDILHTKFLPDAPPQLDQNSLHTIIFRNGSLLCKELNISLVS
ncbi:histidine phosphatase family protein [Desulfopila inferna]|uniref:histidine phosphatase family protein n=1 Tax=Desulfopila inferna TaxID=468528 RepID=UPI001963AFD8|nr:histidine phosphatase family protein [Desulfopila inferna]MBM9605524.1 histidine phosphatase family protein [Desulfopila inferna]